MIKEIGPDPFGEFNNKIATGEVTLPPAQEIPKEVLEQNNTQQTTEQNFDMYNQQANMTTMAQQVQSTQPNVYSQQVDMTNQQMNMSNIAQPMQPNPYDQQMNMANMAQPMQTNTVPPIQPNSYNQQMNMTNMTQQMQPMQQNAYNQQMNMAQPMQQTMYTPQNNIVPPIQPNVYNQMSMTQPVQTQPSFNIPAVEDTTPVDNTTPVVNNVTPVVDNTAPVVNNTPVVDNTVPVVDNTTPVVNSTVPVVDNTINNIAPTVDNTVPVVDNTTPVVNSTVPVVDNTINNIAPTVDNTVPVVDNTAPVVDNTAISAPTLTKLNITPANVPNKKLTDCNLDELLAAVSDIVSENCYQYINKVLGNDIEIATLSDTPSKAECANLLNSIPLTINSVEKWIAVETELEKNAELYKKASDWVTSTIRENSGNPKFAMGRSDVVIGLYRKYYNSTEDLSQAKKAKSSKAESDSKESDLTESSSEQPKPKRTRSSKKKNNTVTDTRATVPLIEQPNQTPVEQATASTVPPQMAQPANFSMPTPMEQTVTQTTPVTSTTTNDTSTMPFEW